MAEIGKTYYDMIDLYKSLDGRGSLDIVIEMLMELNPILDDAMSVECNLGTKHRHTIRTGLPSVAWGKLYSGIPQSKSGKIQVEDTTGFVEGLSSIDERLLKLSGGKGDALRLGEAESYLEAISQEVASKIFYGSDAASPEQFMGLAPRFADLNAANGNQIIDAGGTGADNTSIWIVTWGDSQCQLLHPKGTMAGIEREDMGRQRVTDGDGNAYYVKEEMFTQHVGLAVKDWRYVSRVANVDVSNLAAGSVDLYKFLRKAFYKHQTRRIPKFTSGMQGTQRQSSARTVIYCNSDVLEALDGLSVNAGTTDNFTRLRPMEIEGKEIPTYRGLPLRESDAILNTEARVVGL